jgi:hypothetical protein
MERQTARVAPSGTGPPSRGLTMKVHRLGRVGAVLATAIALGACLSACGIVPDNQAALHEQAQADLDRWDRAVASAGGSATFVPVGQLTSQIGDWELEVGNNNKIALMAGLVESVGSLPTAAPPDGTVTWADGTNRAFSLVSAAQALADVKADPSNTTCLKCTPLRVTDAQLVTTRVETSRGPAEAPVWSFTIAGTAVKVTRLAVADAVVAVPPAWDSNSSPVGLSVYAATTSATGRDLTVSFVGAPGPGSQSCGADYTAEAVESSKAVVVIVTTHPHWSLFGESCTAIGAERTAVAKMTAPLGDRTVLEVVQGLPVATTVTP